MIDAINPLVHPKSRGLYIVVNSNKSTKTLALDRLPLFLPQQLQSHAGTDESSK